MKKIFGWTLGGLQQKIFNLVLIVVLLLIGVYSAVSIYQTNNLGNVVSEASTEQGNAINKVSGDTMHQVLDSSLVTSNGMQAYIADDMFLDMKNDVLSLQSLAEGLFAHKGEFEPHPFYPPDASKDGEYSAQVLWDENVDYENSEYLGVASHMSETMIAMCKSSNYLSNAFIGLSDGTLLCIDNQSASKFDENGNIPNFKVFERPWYKGAVEAGELYFTGIEADTYTDKVGIECSAPIYANNVLIGVVGVDLFLDSMADYVNESATNGGFICVLNDKGQIIFAPENNGIFEVELSDNAPDLRKSDNKELAKFASLSLKEQTGLNIISINEKDYYMTAAPMETVGWAVISVIDKEITELPAQMMIAEYERINNEATSKFQEGTNGLKNTTLLLTIVILLLGTGGALILAGRIVKPIEHMTEQITDLGVSKSNFKMDNIYNTKDEIEILAKAFNDLSERTNNYIDQITKITAEKERIGAELELATKIQADMLPNIFPAFPEREEFDIFASMTPAKEVGGDFYDFFLIDDDHLGMVIADVSGKGVPAALFMMMSKILVSNYAMMGGSPASILEHVNTQISKKNNEEMFVTVWFGILEISTGKVTAANAGHEYPILKKADGQFELLKDKHGFVIGGMDGIRYKDYEFTLEKGGTLFLYTDGVAEATNSENQLFGTERMLEALNIDPQAEPKILLKTIKKSVDEFVGDSPQFDDLTMLCVKLVN